MRLIIFFILLSFGADAQIIRANPFYVRNVTNVDTLLLDSFTTAGIAFSVRKLRTAYTGNCLKVRRSSDNAEQDIGFVNNYLDTATIKTFVGSSRNGFVTTWYDQSGNGYDASTSTATRQPKIYDSATNAITRRNNQVSLSIDGSDQLDFTNAGPLTNNIGYFHFFGVGCNTNTTSIRAWFQTTTNSSANNRALVEFNRTTANRHGYSGRRLDAVASASIVSSSNYSTTNLQLYTVKVDYASSDIYLYRNGADVGSSTSFLTDGNTSATDAAATYMFGSNGASFMIGSCSEIVIYTTDQSSNRTSIQNNINRNFSLY